MNPEIQITGGSIDKSHPLLSFPLMSALPKIQPEDLRSALCFTLVAAEPGRQIILLANAVLAFQMIPHPIFPLAGGFLQL